MASPSRSQADGNHHQEPIEDGGAPKSNSAVEETIKAFKAVVEREDQALREQFGNGFSPMQAQARALLWLVALHDIHMSAVKEAMGEGDGEAVRGWAEDLGKLSAAIAVLETIQPIAP